MLLELQNSLSSYLRETVNPPRDLLSLCLWILHNHKKQKKEIISTQEILACCQRLSPSLQTLAHSLLNDLPVDNSFCSKLQQFSQSLEKQSLEKLSLSFHDIIENIKSIVRLLLLWK